jgi:glutamyl-tRNA synthetase
VRGDDLADSTPRQVWLGRALGLGEPVYVHVPLVLGPDGARLAKRHGAVTLREIEPGPAFAWIAGSLGMRGRSAAELLEEFDPARIPAEPAVFGAN